MLNSVTLAGRVDVRPFGCLQRNVQLYTANKWLALEEHNFCTHMHVHKKPSIFKFHPNVNDRDLHFKGLRFESGTLGRSNVIISQAVTDRTNIAIANT